MVAAAFPLWCRYAAKFARTPGGMGNAVPRLKVAAKAVKTFHFLRYPGRVSWWYDA